MTADLRDQMRELCAFIEDEQGSITVDDVWTRTSDAPVSTVSPVPISEITITEDAAFDLLQPVESATHVESAKRRVVLALAVAAVILLVVGLVVADRNSGNVVNVVTDEVSVPSVVESPAPVAVADLDSSLWSLVSYESGTDFLGVVAAGPGFVAVGGRDGNAAVWTSVDGLTWSRVPHDEAVFGGPGESAMAAVAVGGPGLVAVGSQTVCTEQEVLDEGGLPRVDEVGNPEPDTVCVDGNAAVWTSVDGLTWSRVPHDEAVFGGPRRVYGMNSITPGGPGLVAVGQSDRFGEGDPLNEGDVNEGDAVVWTSVDGLTWTRVPHDEAVFGGAETQGMFDVTAGGPGLVAVGRDGAGMAWDNSRGQDAAVWTSVDGLTWSRVPDDEDAFAGNNSIMLGVTSGGPGLVAVGREMLGPAAVWTSVDGLTWSRVTHDNESEMSEPMGDVAVVGPGLLAVGSRDTEAAVWTSPDGLTWSLAPNISIPEPGPSAARRDRGLCWSVDSSWPGCS